MPRKAAPKGKTTGSNSGKWTGKAWHERDFQSLKAVAEGVRFGHTVSSLAPVGRQGAQPAEMYQD